MMVIWLIVGAAFLFWFLACWTILSIIKPAANKLDEQVKIYENAYKQVHGGADSEQETSILGGNPVLNQAVNLTSNLASKGGLIDSVQRRVEDSGLPLRASEFIFLHVMATIVIAAVSLILFANILLTILVTAIALVIPLPLLAYLKRRRDMRFHDQLPDTLGLIAGALKAGYSFMQAVDITAQETSPPISNEFKRVLAETRLGLPLEEALAHMAVRVHSTSFDWTVMAVNIQREVGGNLAEVLEILADTIRQRDAVLRQIKVLTSEGRLSAFIMIALPIVISGLLYIVNPNYILPLVQTTAGLALVAVAVVMLIIGALWLRKIVVIEV